METKPLRIAELAKSDPKTKFTSLAHLWGCGDPFLILFWVDGNNKEVPVFYPSCLFHLIEHHNQRILLKDIVFLGLDETRKVLQC
jgi:hypothetical protein